MSACCLSGSVAVTLLPYCVVGCCLVDGWDVCWHGHKFESEKRSGFGRRDGQEADRGARRDFFELGVELSVEEFRSCDQAASLGDEECGVAQVEAFDERVGKD